MPLGHTRIDLKSTAMRRTLTPLLLTALSCAGFTQTEWMGMYIQGKKVGYAMYTSGPDPKGTLSESVSVLDGKMLGVGLKLSIKSKTWSDASGQVSRMEFDLESGGRLQKVIAVFDRGKVVASTETEGRKTSKTLELPNGAHVVDDVLAGFLNGKAEKEVYVFDPNTLELVKCVPKVIGQELVETSLGKVEATVVDVQDPRAPMKMYLSPKGDLIKATGPFGLEMRPVSKAIALADGESVDISLASAIVPDKAIDDFLNLKSLTLQVTGLQTNSLKSDDHQTVTQVGDSLRLKIHPVQPDLDLVDGSKPTSDTWVSPDIHIPSDSKRFIELAGSVTSGSKNLIERVERIRSFVNRKLKTNAGIGVLRDADDILDAGDGVCRDHAILMATLLRADKVPTRIVSGLVYGMGAFYYHAWVEVWTGKRWLGVDSTRPTSGLDATHIKIGQGTVGEAFTSFLIDGAKISVIDP